MQAMEPASDVCLRLEGPQWLFAVDLYQRPGVSKACLLLQDLLGADISLLLFVLFVAEKYRTMLDPSELESLDNVIAAWRCEVIWPLRSIRRRMKTGPDPAPCSTTAGLLEQIKEAEIHAEQIELAVLAQWFDRRQHIVGTTTVGIADLLDQLVIFFGTRSANLEEDASADVHVALKAIADAMAHRSSLA